MNKNKFIERVAKVAIEGYGEYGILPSLTIAQAILESDWGNKHIENNIFGIKAGSSWKGKVAIRKTKGGMVKNTSLRRLDLELMIVLSIVLGII